MQDINKDSKYLMHIYCALIFKLFELRELQDAGQDLDNEEDILLEDMDRAWLRLDLDEVNAVEEMAKLLKRPRRPRLGHGLAARIDREPTLDTSTSTKR